MFTGDMFPNIGRPIRHDAENEYQTNWWKKMEKTVDTLRELIGGRPVVVVDGNHDFVSLARLMMGSGFENVSGISSEGLINVCGLTMAGFPNIPYIEGEWNFETRYPELSELIDKVVALCPDILVTHAPPANILDAHGYGMNALSMMIQYNPELLSFRHHFFGHAHECGGMTDEVNGIKFYNSATEIKLHSVS